MTQLVSGIAAGDLDLDGQDEREVIARARADRAAFTPIYRAHYTAIAGYLYRRTGDAHAAEDLAGDTFLAALRTVHRFRPGRASVRAWLYRIATNQANRWARRRRLAASAVAAAPGAPAIPADAAAAADEWPRAHAALMRIHPRHQAVLVLHHVEGLSVEQVGAVLGCRVGTVKSRLSRARVALRNELERSHG